MIGVPTEVTRLQNNSEIVVTTKDVFQGYHDGFDIREKCKDANAANNDMEMIQWLTEIDDDMFLSKLFKRIVSNNTDKHTNALKTQASDPESYTIYRNKTSKNKSKSNNMQKSTRNLNHLKSTAINNVPTARVTRLQNKIVFQGYHKGFDIRKKPKKAKAAYNDVEITEEDEEDVPLSVLLKSLGSNNIDKHINGMILNLTSLFSHKPKSHTNNKKLLNNKLPVQNETDETEKEKYHMGQESRLPLDGAICVWIRRVEDWALWFFLPTLRQRIKSHSNSYTTNLDKYY